MEFERLCSQKLDSIFTTKSVKISPNFDKPFITSEIKKLDRKVKREYRKHQRSAKYLRLKEAYDRKYEKAAADYLEKAVRSLKEDDPGRAYRCLKKMAAQPGDYLDEGSFTLLSHSEDNLSPEQSIEKIAQHFAKISQEFQPLNYDLLPKDVQTKLDQPIIESELPIVADHDVYEKICKQKKPRSSVPGDVPRRIVQEFAPEFATPAGIIFRNITKTGHWPKPWRTEYGTPLQKETNPVSEDQLRIISLTSFFSKVYEQYVMIWLLKYVGKQMDWGQYGGTKGSSISHYMIDLVNFILYNQDLNIPHAVLAVMIDFAKAFNRINHNTVITILSRMGVPGWLLRIVMGFLTERELIVRYKGGTSDRKMLPGGGPQGTILGLFLFMILINAAGYNNLERNMGYQITQKKSKRNVIPNIHMKFVDDMTLAGTMNLRECLVPNPDTNQPFPLAFHDRTQHVLPESLNLLQEQLDKMIQYCEENSMMINHNKTKVVLFNTARKYDFMPRLSIEPGINLEVVEEFKLLGIMFQSNLRWQANTDFMCQKAYSRLWMLRRLKKLGAEISEMLDVYQKQVRCVLEMAVAVWEPGLTIAQSKQIERVQKCAFYIILGASHTTYGNALKQLGGELLSERRQKLCLKFAKKSEKHTQFSSWFEPTEERELPLPNTRSDKTVLKYKPVTVRTDRYMDSPLPHLTDLLNNYYDKKK